MNGGQNRKRHTFGYTIVEVMIVLAVTGVMFIVAAGFIQGKQGNVEFRQSVTDLSSTITTTINDVTNGYYPSGQKFTCTSNGGAAPQLAGGTSPQGTNAQCIFLGKVMHFYTDQGDNAFEILSVAGARLNGSGEPVASLQEAHPTAIYDTASGGAAFDATDKQTLEDGTVITNVKDYRTNGGTSSDYGFAILTNLSSSQADSNGLLASGTTSIGLYGFNPSYPLAAGKDEGTAVNDTAQITDADTINKAVICLQNGNHKAFITVQGGKFTSDITWEPNATTWSAQCS